MRKWTKNSVRLISSTLPAGVPVLDSAEDVLAALRELSCRLFVSPDDNSRGSQGSWSISETTAYLVNEITYFPISRAAALSQELWTLGKPFHGLVPGPEIAIVPEGVCQEINKRLHDEADEIRHRSCWPIRRCFVYLDISDYSTYEPGQQALIVDSIPGLLREAQSHFIEPDQKPEREIFSGDGYVLSFRSALTATRFAARLATEIENAVARERIPVEVHFRMGVHVGEVYAAREHPDGRLNYAGDGINGGKRVMDAIGQDADDLVFLSEEVRRAILEREEEDLANSDILNNLVNRGRRKDKHGRPWRV